ncbi:MAG: hypothetical protein HYT98_04100 [Candidatus Sungbacteria bacterium]|nr:hypothetical protein [Candidatus Sungbacteria bacterium]
MPVKREKIERPEFNIPERGVINNPGATVEEAEEIKKRINEVLKKNKKDLKKKARRKRRRHIQEKGE